MLHTKFGQLTNARTVLVTALIAIALFISAVTPQPASAVSCYPNYVVKKGDNLYRIALAAGTSWQVLANINRIWDPNHILVGQVICLPPVQPGTTATPISPAQPTTKPATTVPTVAPTMVKTAVPTAVGGAITLPPAGVYPTIDFNTRTAGSGDVITITGKNFPTNEPVDIYIVPFGYAYPLMPAGSAKTNNDGTLSTQFTIPNDANGQPLRGWALSIKVQGKQTSYFGFNYVVNPRP